MKTVVRTALFAGLVPLLGSVSQAQQDLKVKSEIITRSGVVRITWQQAPPAVKRFRITGPPRASQFVASSAADTTVVRDAPTERAAIQYALTGYDQNGVIVVGARGTSNSVTPPTPDATTVFQEDFDDGRLDSRWSDILDTKPDGKSLPWVIAAGRLSLGVKQAGEKSYSVQVDLGNDAVTAPVTGLELTARVLLPNGKDVDANTEIPVGEIRLAGRGDPLKAPTLRLVIVKDGGKETGTLGVKVLDETGNVLGNTYRPQPNNIAGGDPFWVYLQREGNKIRYSIWKDSLDTIASADKGPKATAAQADYGVAAASGPFVVFNSTGQTDIQFGEVYVAAIGAKKTTSGIATPQSALLAIEHGFSRLAALFTPPPRKEPGAPEPPKTPFPFTTTASVTRILHPGEFDPDAPSGNSPLDHSTLSPKAEGDYQAFSFSEPADFPLPRFDSCGQEFDGDGATIPEGMSFAATPDGDYEVDFVVNSPAMLVALRMRLEVYYKDGNPPVLINLPPLVIPPYKNDSGEFEAASYRVRQRGHSAAIAKRTRDGKPREWQTVKRAGTARFGNYPTDESRPY